MVTAMGFGFVRCGGGGPDSSELYAGDDRALVWLKKPSEVTPFAGRSCLVRDAVNVDHTEEKGKTLLWARGGGWENADTLQSFAKENRTGGYIAIVLSATALSSSQGAQYFFDYYSNRMSGSRLNPIYTSADGSHGANDSEKVSVIEGASAVILTGGYPDRLRHLHGTRVGNAIRDAYQKGIPIYTNSASVSLIGSYFAWDLSRGVESGLGLVYPSFLSHLEDPAKYGQRLEDLWKLVPNRLSQSFGLTSGTVGVVTGGWLTVRGTDTSTHRAYLYDKELPRTENCAHWILLPGESFPLRTR